MCRRFRWSARMADSRWKAEDTAVSILKFKSGVIATTRHTWASAAPKTWYTIRAYCEKANLTLTMDPLGSLVREGPDCAFRSQIVVSPPDSILVDSDEGLDFSGEVKHFFDCLDTGQACQTTALWREELWLWFWKRTRKQIR